MTCISVNPEFCTGCLNCMAVCAQFRAGSADRKASAVCVILDPFTGDHRFRFCRQCRNAPCARGCPRNAIQLNQKTGGWQIDRELCIRCGACVQNCPFEAMFWWSDENGPVKCDLCKGKFRCVSACHFGVLGITSSDNADDAAERSILK